MSGVALVFGRIGPDIVDDLHVVELLQRTVEGQYRATSVFDKEVELLVAHNKPVWTQPISSLTLLHSQWLAAMLWQMATSFLDGVVKRCHATTLDLACRDDLAGRQLVNLEHRARIAWHIRFCG